MVDVRTNIGVLDTQSAAHSKNILRKYPCVPCVGGVDQMVDRKWLIYALICDKLVKDQLRKANNSW